jgi:hypothetical protein
MIHTLAGVIDQKEIVQTTVSFRRQTAISADYCLRSVHSYTSQASYIREADSWLSFCWQKHFVYFQLN